MRNIIAITGPSGVGKTTLGNNLVLNLNYKIPRHVTTRPRRPDDATNFYRYLTHEEYRRLFEDNQFLISSGDGPAIDKQYGNFYGILTADCIDAWETNPTIIFFVSYKDIDRIEQLKTIGYPINLVNLTFQDIPKGVKYRLERDKSRNHTSQEIESRVNCAISDHALYSDKLQACASVTIFTDTCSIEQTYQTTCKELKLIKSRGA